MKRTSPNGLALALVYFTKYRYLDGDDYLHRIDMRDPYLLESEAGELPLCHGYYLIGAKYIYTSNGNCVLKEDWKKLTDTNETLEEIQVFTSPEYTIHHELNSEGNISAKYLMSHATAGGSSFR